MKEINYGTKEYWEKLLSNIIKTIEEDKDKLIDIITDKCMSMDILIPLHIGETARYEVTFLKSALRETEK